MYADGDRLWRTPQVKSHSVIRHDEMRRAKLRTVGPAVFAVLGSTLCFELDAGLMNSCSSSWTELDFREFALRLPEFESEYALCSFGEPDAPLSDLELRMDLRAFAGASAVPDPAPSRPSPPR